MSSRAERRRRMQAGAAPAVPRSSALVTPAIRRRWTAVVAVALLALVVGMRFAWLHRRITWYLAVDQFGYVSFANDILSGRLLHHWAPADALAKWMPARTDVLVQSYIFDAGRIYSRYAPGFPILLAAWIALLGPEWMHYLNPILFCAGLVLLAAFEHRLTRSWWRGVAVASLVVLCPSQINWWGLTLTRDVATHVVAFSGLFLLLPHGTRRLGDWRTALAGLVLGFAASMRPDATMYLLPATLIGLQRWWRERQGNGPGVVRVAATAAAGYALGIAPLLAYDLAATGSFLPPQSIELNHLLSDLRDLVVPPVYALGWHGGIWDPVQGGALQVANLRHILPLQLEAIQAGYGPILCGAAVAGVAVAFVVRRTLFLAAVPYAIVSLLFFSCWVRPDARYLIGFHFWIPMLIVEGTLGSLDLVRLIERRGARLAGQALAGVIGVALVAAAALANGGRDPLPVTAWIVAFVTAAAALGAVLWPQRRVVRFAAPVMAVGLAVLATWTDWTGLGRYASFQRTEMLRARATFQQAVGPDAIVITTEDVGRPMENIEYYGDRRAVYLTDLARWHLPVPFAATRLLSAGLRPYLLLPTDVAETRRIVQTLEKLNFTAELVRDIPPQQAMDYFVAAPFHRGIRMSLYRLHNEKLEAELAKGAGGPAAPSGARTP